MGGRQYHKPHKASSTSSHVKIAGSSVTAEPLPQTWCENVPTLPPQLPEAPKSILELSDRVALSLATAIAIVLFLEEKTPIVVAVLLGILFLCGLYILWHLIRVFPWVRQVPSGSPRFISTILIVALAWAAVVTLYGTKKWPQRHYAVEIVFKESPAWTKERKRLVLNSLDDYFSYLQGIGFPFPRKLPPIALMKGGIITAGGVWDAGQLYQSMILPDEGNDQGVLAVQAYSRYIFNGYLLWDRSAVSKQFGESPP
jgi:hypothetical protein